MSHAPRPDLGHCFEAPALVSGFLYARHFNLVWLCCTARLMPERCVAAAQELREMVIRGAYEHPGAVAVEDELGRVILLHKLPLNVKFPASLPRNDFCKK